MPPSSDWAPVPKSSRTTSLREKTKKLPGGQPEHPGHTLRLTDTPDHHLVHRVTVCTRCGESLEEVAAKRHRIRQVWDIPPLSIEVTQHEVEVKSCPCCHRAQEAEFPAHVTHSVQYGPRLRALGAYLTQYQLISYKRTAELLSDLFDHTLSEGTLVTMNRQMSEVLIPVEQEIYDHLLSSPVLHVDETGMRVAGKRYWLHVASTSKATLYTLHPKRVTAAINDMNVLPHFKGTAMHDSWSPYFRYKVCAHALCNAHHLRELKAIWEIDGQVWAQDMMDLLRWMKEEREQTNSPLSAERIQQWEAAYDHVLHRGFKRNPAPLSTEQKGKTKQSTAKNLLDRLSLHRDSVLAFLRDASVPFDNNQAERDLRMAKVKQNISGTF